VIFTILTAFSVKESGAGGVACGGVSGVWGVVASMKVLLALSRADQRSDGCSSSQSTVDETGGSIKAVQVTQKSVHDLQASCTASI
jgi:hypothetical protein